MTLTQSGHQVVECASEEGNVVEGVLRQLGHNGASLLSIGAEDNDSRVVVFDRQAAVVFGGSDLGWRDVAGPWLAATSKLLGRSTVNEDRRAIDGSTM